ncbi:MAG: hypothetical protein A2275_07170 [Bacteroidetes bacterium RIFOXYA12_FULL_35_11]|nr:MAG: hypothetical protein A2X01_04475 [Bacteroidetes bacterium GWF2_35_48]OFY83204.1 MAG: hypothetical protein A2275_07170 [Bacteroidetes bacterium RIFOXYA12_FULL_35_11]OFY97056.1 MAG: hypothetical protein A2309_00660 [Bacteroidetes bacterium RIFOXYB2_FULL_35_7]OFY97565.1 MAG: hypothetical protein A2491_05105 [Bacteroidetes bacterium RIFOXYC12_FULL_35_7]HBX53266.1 hypothetical protein [Bacteroidales bacterium]
MPSFEVHKTVNFSVFSQFVRGSFLPVSLADKNIKSSLQLVRSANTHIIISESTKEEVSRKISLIDLTDYGYYSTSDIDLKFIYNSETNSHQAVICPLKVYQLYEEMLLPSPADDRERFFLDFFADEFERVKIRAEKMLAAASNKEIIQINALRNIQFARKLFHDSRLLYRSISSKNSDVVHQSDIYIIYILNLFIIRAIIFYSEFFKPFLDEPLLSEEELLLELHQETPSLLKHPLLYKQRPLLYEFLNTCMAGTVVNDVIAPYTQKQSKESIPVAESIPPEIKILQQLKGKFQLNCNSNIFLDVIFQFIRKQAENGSPWLNCDYSELTALLNYFFTDKDGNPLNPSSIRTVLKPSNFKKRPHPDDPNKFDINNFSDSAEIKK